MRGRGFARSGVVAGAVAFCLVLGATGARAQEPALVDRIVAVVDGEVITLGQLDRAIGRIQAGFSIDIGICGPGAGTVGAATPGTEDLFARQVLDCMIDDMLAFQHVRRFPQFAVLQDDIDAEYQRIVQQYDDRAAFEEALKLQELTAAEVRYDLERVALVDSYVQIRYRDVIDVRETEIRRYYDEVLRPEMEREGAEMPAFDAVDDMIEAILVEADFDHRTADWIADLRRRADIVVYLW